jgi:hypothetical protein
MSSIPNQVGPNGSQPYSNQQNAGQIVGELQSWVPHCPQPILFNFLNNAARVYYGRRNWYGIYVKGQIISPGYTSTGTVTLTQGSVTVTGNGTGWTSNLGGQPIIGQQLRVGFTSPIYTIVGANLMASPQTLTLELPWGMPSQSATGYYISQFYYVFSNVKRFISVKNLMMMYRLITGVPQALLENWDPSRLEMMYPRVVATMPPDPSGNSCFELWPVPNTPQAFPYLAMITPPNLVNDEDNLPAFMRCDVVKARALSEAILYRPKSNPHYSESMCLQLSATKTKEFEREIVQAEQDDEGINRQDIITASEMLPMVTIDWATGKYCGGGGGFLAAMSPASSYGNDW